MAPSDDNALDFWPPRPWAAEGARVALVTCSLCGAALLLDPADEREGRPSPLDLHREFHEGLDG